MANRRKRPLSNADDIAKELYELLQTHPVKTSVKVLSEKYNVSIDDINYIRYKSHKLFFPKDKVHIRDKVLSNVSRFKSVAKSKTELTALVANELGVSTSTVRRYSDTLLKAVDNTNIDNINIEAKLDNNVNPKNLVITFTISLKELRKRSKQ